MNCLVNIDVDDLPRAVRFFQAAFDLRPARRLGDGVVEMLGSAAPIYLLAKPAGSPSHAACAAGESPDARRYDRHWTPVHLDFVVDDLDAAIERAISAGAVLEKPPATQAWGRLALMADPFGNGFCFVQFLGRGYDEIAT